jgi:hypothetical protein
MHRRAFLTGTTAAGLTALLSRPTPAAAHSPTQDLTAWLHAQQAAHRAECGQTYFEVDIPAGEWSIPDVITLDGPIGINAHKAHITFEAGLPKTGAIKNKFVKPVLQPLPPVTAGMTQIPGLGGQGGDIVVIQSDDDRGHVSSKVETPRHLYRLCAPGVLDTPTIHDYTINPKWAVVPMTDRVELNGFNHQTLGRDHRVVNLRQVTNAVFDDITAGEDQSGAWQMFDCYGARVCDFTIESMANPGKAPWGYGLVLVASTTDVDVTNLEGGTVRHLITTNIISDGALFRGGVRDVKVRDSRCFSSKSAAFDTHYGSDQVMFARCIVDQSDTIGIQLRGDNQSVIDCEASDCNKSLSVSAGARNATAYGFTSTRARKMAVDLGGIDGLVTDSDLRGDSIQTVSVRSIGAGTGARLERSDVRGYGFGDEGTVGDVATTGNRHD